MTDPIDDLLAEEGLSTDDVLRAALIELRDTTTAVRPMPSAELAALLSPERARVAARRSPRVIVTTLIVIGAVGAGVTAAAASPEVRGAIVHVVQGVIAAVVPAPSAPPSQGTTTSPGTPSADPTSGATTHPGPTDHPSSTDHPGATDHPSATDHPQAPATGKSSGSSGHSQATSHPVPAPAPSPTPHGKN